MSPVHTWNLMEGFGPGMGSPEAAIPLSSPNLPSMGLLEGQGVGGGKSTGRGVTQLCYQLICYENESLPSAWPSVACL